MKKNHNISACLAIFMASLSLFSCSSEDDTQYSTAGQLGDISVDRTKKRLVRISGLLFRVRMFPEVAWHPKKFKYLSTASFRLLSNR